MKKVALFGNPNTGKSSIFNRLTGMKQHVGNFPGVTVDKTSGFLQQNGQKIQIVDFPGTYSIYPRSKDEQVVYDVISNPSNPDYPELAVVIVDASNLERNLLLFSQIYDLGIPTVMVLNMTDVAARKNLQINPELLQETFPESVILRSNARIGTGIQELKEILSRDFTPKQPELFGQQAKPRAITDQSGQEQDTEYRFHKIKTLIAKVVESKEKHISRSGKIDRWLTHPIFGYVFFFLLILLIFQTVFTVASYPMDWIDAGINNVAAYLQTALPYGMFTRLLTEGIIPGIGGVLIFVPQIALLFFLLSILEETGYMARVVFLMDRLMRPFGLNGKSVVPLISSAACAIPGIMSTRTISNWNERLTTILVAPLISCSARIPVYTLLIALVIPKQTVWGVFSLQGLVLFGLYALGIVSALFVSWIFKLIFKNKELSVFLLELPSYKSPRWGNVGLNVLSKVKIFILDAGKIILAISIILWALASFGPGNEMDEAAKQVPLAKNQDLPQYEQQVAAAKLEHSYIGHLGKAIEPVIRPLGYDWKMGISLLTSFAAREVFVGSLATIYSVQNEDDEIKPLIERLREEKRPDGTPVYSLASGLSLLVFYVYAMQCMATLAIVKRETKSWRWPLIQVGYMGILAYLGAFIVYQIFS